MLTLSMVLTVPAFAASATVTSFSDVPSTHWAYSNVTAMTANGLFSGTTNPVNGVGTFAPEATMTCAEFITVIDRALYKDTALSTTDPWWQSAYDLAISKGIIKAGELDMTKAMTRQEMAMVMVRASNETPTQLVATSKIADYSTIGAAYTDYVLKAYSMGMLTGMDNNGTFAPTATMNRAQGATVLNRLTNKSARVTVDFSVPTTNTEIKNIDTTTPDQVTTKVLSDAEIIRYYIVDTTGYVYLRVTAATAMDDGSIFLYTDMKDALAGNCFDGGNLTSAYNVSSYSKIVVSVREYKPSATDAPTPITMTLEGAAPIPSYSIPAGATALTDANTTFSSGDTKYANGQFVRCNMHPGCGSDSIQFKNAGYSTLTFTVTTKETAMGIAVYQVPARATGNSRLSVAQSANTTKTYTVGISGLSTVQLFIEDSGDCCDSVITNMYVK